MDGNSDCINAVSAAPTVGKVSDGRPELNKLLCCTASTVNRFSTAVSVNRFILVIGVMGVIALLCRRCSCDIIVLRLCR